ncbi:hypothetical protein [Sulfurisoma sediminicola]|uniref:Dolichyl-phosphate-mannose-protein mannosyltransferase n=1 Tax=Sulfurisoma sediminicola TaxID=1381557 RepID=A0A497XBA6_9PROT|nr:hypothetical protein [Sulfurisoma sediminicola]RLJ63663.1 hypothetical protein DFR35_2293 [Sulfurisoma sediminicola]
MSVAEHGCRDFLRASVIITLAAMAYIYWFAEPDGPIFHRLLYRHDLAGAIGLLFLLALLPLSKRVALDPTAIALAVARYHWLIAGMVWLLLSIGSRYLYHSHPLSMDEYAASFQAAVFANGSLAGRVPPQLMDWVLPDEFQGHFFAVNRVTGDLASAYWPGFALLLAPFVWLGIPWACNPLIVAASVLLAGQLAREVVGQESARGWAILLALASPAFTLNGISFYSMPAHLLFNLIFVWLLLRPSPGRVFLAGVVGSFALVLHNPYPHLLFSLPWLAWLVFRRDGGMRNALLLALGYMPLLLLLGVGWIATLGALRQLGQATVTSGAQAEQWPWLVRVAIGLTRPFHFPDEITLSRRLASLVKLWLWSAPFLLFMAVLAANRLRNPLLKLMGASLLLTILGYFLVPVTQGHGWGDRYSHSAFGVLPVLAAAWMCSTPAQGNRDATLLPLVAKAALLSLLLATGLRAWQIGTFMNDHLAQLPPYPKDRPAIVFVGKGYYSRDLVQNDPWLRTQPWVFASRGKDVDIDVAEKLLPGGCIYADGWHGWTFAVPGDKSRQPSVTTSKPSPC